MKTFLGRARTRVVAGIAASLLLVATGAVAGAQAYGSNDGRPDGTTGRAGSSSPTENTFVPITPCRIVNTQNPAGRLVNGETRSYRMHGNTQSQGGAAACNIPATATALEVTVHAVGAAGTGYLRVFPAAGSEPNATFLNYGSGLNQSNTGTITVTPGNAANFRVKAYLSSVHVIVDVAGYYQSEMFAVVAADGTVTRGNGVVSSDDFLAGEYEVIFDRDVSGCGYTAVIGTTDTGSEPDGTATVARRSTNPNGVFVQTYNTGGTSVDRSFHLIVDC